MSESDVNLSGQALASGKRRKKSKKPRLKAKTRLKLLEKLKAEKAAKRIRAKQYLNDWANRDESEWKFRKSDQIWLMKNWHKPDELDSNEFKIFLEYIAGTEDGSAVRRKLVNDALQLMESPDFSDIVRERARSLIQLL